MGTRVMSDFSHDTLPRRDNRNENPQIFRKDGLDLPLIYDGPPPLINNGSPERPQQTQTDQVKKLAGLSIGFCGMFAEQLLSHPCIVLRRQCQVHHAGAWYHLTPISLIQTVINIQRSQGGLVLWKGLGSVYIVRGIGMVSETVVSEITSFPREVSRHSSLKRLGGHILLKGIVFAISTPFLAASLVETVQSEIASERPGVLDVLFEGVARIGMWGTPHAARQIPVWQLALPTVIFRLSHYIVNSIAQFTVTSAMHLEQQEMREQPGENGREPSVYETYFPDLLAAFTGGFLADMITFPMETVLHRLYVQGTRTIIDNTDTGLGVVPINTRYEGFFDCFTCIVKEDGLQGLYRGFGALLLQYAIHALILRLVKFMFEKLSQEFDLRQKQQKASSLARKSRTQDFGFGEG
ncbi:unnamed protein product [Candidula unifasciata]|uniref:Solute carrier family 25 member 46 n=1 Tax=Candidula unifasciata TaxID=100452 RepID=A0A8S3ZUF2_9EUPU|nr:unnamed protein product [Candidula unifasciata]